MEIIKLKIHDLKPYEKNAKLHPQEQIDQIKKSIEEFGMNDPIAIWGKDNIIVEGHERCHVIMETSEKFSFKEVAKIVNRLAGNIYLDLQVVKQDKHLSKNQNGKVRCGDNGIFKGVPLTWQEKNISKLARDIYERYPYDGKYILTDDKFICCQSNASNEELHDMLDDGTFNVIINPLGDWTGGTNVDTGATNRKLGSDMAQSVTGGGLHGKDLSKADVSVNIYAFKKAQETGETVSLCCAIGDKEVDGKPYSEIVEEARQYIKEQGGFEKFAEWGLY